MGNSPSKTKYLKVIGQGNTMRIRVYFPDQVFHHTDIYLSDNDKLKKMLGCMDSGLVETHYSIATIKQVLGEDCVNLIRLGFARVERKYQGQEAWAQTAYKVSVTVGEQGAGWLIFKRADQIR